MEHPHVPGLSDWETIGSGSSSVVWQACQTTLERLVAVKVYERELGEADQRRFLREAAALGRLSGHPGILTSHAAGMLADDRPYLVVEVCPGGSLARWLEPGNRPSEERVRQVGVQIADALAAAHARGLLHGDVNPANILIDEYGSPKLADFGLAAIEGVEPGRGSGARLTPAYAPPEALRMQPTTGAGDVFSLAATLYALLAGEPPREVGHGRLAPEQLVELSRRPIVTLPAVNWFLMDVLMTAMSEEPADRPTASGFRDQLAAVRLDRPAGHRAVRSAASAGAGRAGGDQAHAAPAGRQGHGRVAVLTLAVVLIALLGAGSVWLMDEPAPSGAPPVTSPVPESPRPSPSAEASKASTAAGIIRLQPTTGTARPFRAVRIEGWHDASGQTFLRVQRWERGSWRAFPLPTRTDASGNFTAHVEFGQPGRHRVRVVNPDSGAASEPIELEIVEA